MIKKITDDDIRYVVGGLDDEFIEEASDIRYVSYVKTKKAVLKHRTLKRACLLAAAALAACGTLFAVSLSVKRNDGRQTYVTTTVHDLGPAAETTAVTSALTSESNDPAVTSETQKTVYADGSPIIGSSIISPSSLDWEYPLWIETNVFLKKFMQEDDDTLFYVMLDTRFGGLKNGVFSRYSTEPAPDPNDFPMPEQGEYYSEYYKACKERSKKATIPALKDIGVDFEYKPYGYYIGYMKKSDYYKMKEIVSGTLFLLPENFSFEEWHEQLMKK